MPFPPDAAARLRSETFVRSVELHAELGSTNDRALELAVDPDAALPALVLAERQTGGRGRGANRWTAPPGCLTFTLLLEPPATLSGGERADAALLAPVTGLAVAETAAGLTDAEIGVKWPNDVLLRPDPTAPWGKLAGVLCERPRPDRVAVGIGLNLNCDPAAFPSHLPRPAASLRRDRDPHDAHVALAVLIDLLVRLEAAFAELAEGGRLDPARWAARDVLAGRAVRVAAGAGGVSGTACGVTADGALRVFDGHAAREVRSGTVDW